MLALVATLALLLGVAASDNIVFPGPTSRAGQRTSSVRAPSRLGVVTSQKEPPPWGVTSDNLEPPRVMTSRPPHQRRPIASHQWLTRHPVVPTSQFGDVGPKTPLDCPYPPPVGSTLQSLDSRCYEVTDEEEEEVMFVPLSVLDFHCSRGFVRQPDMRCLRVVRRNPNPKPASKNKSWHRLSR